MRIQNRKNSFTILYLPNRSIRLNAKEEFEITPDEFKSKEFEMVKVNFRVIESEIKNKEIKLEIKENIVDESDKDIEIVEKPKKSKKIIESNIKEGILNE